MKETAIRPKNQLQNYEKIADKELGRLFGDETNLVKINCPACGIDAQKERFTAKYNQLYEKCSCGTVYLNPRPDYAAITKFHSESESANYWSEEILKNTEEARKDVIWKQRMEYVAEVIYKNFDKDYIFRMLDVGCSIGTSLEVLRKSAPKGSLEGAELNSRARRICREKGFKVYNSIEGGKIEAESYDIVTMFEVIQQSFYTDKFLASVCKILKQEGLLILSFPCIDGFDYFIMGKDHPNFSFPQINFFSKDGMSELLKKNGFDVTEFTTPGLLDASMARDYGMTHCEDRFKDCYLMKLLLGEDGEKNVNVIQDMLRSSGSSGHAFLVAKKAHKIK
ncbi:MAG: class I SAM-dependent methyltransferase [Candidatus Omnitrophica bacterium]|nr:class I SAM-dependent methyltransferase [Candidatus Omnitrophota bacterium]MBU4487940.1 class I SAM-dependent methyltransferase [Candidatus Omnitrophota bacterium]MCG2705702.1 class I SAM-dependent methyltransferase [Candidatus Omnitrophota bacterium]